MGCGASSENVEIMREAQALEPYVRKGDHAAVRAGLDALKRTGTSAHNLTYEQEVNAVASVLITEQNSRTGNETNNALLHHAVRKNNAQILEELCRHGPNVNIKNSLGYTPLHVSCIFGSGPEVVRVLLKNKADIDIRDDKGNTPLHLAARNLRGWIVKLLLEAGAARDVKNDDNESPLEAANANNAQLQRRSTYRLKQAQDPGAAGSGPAGTDDAVTAKLMAESGTIDVIRDLLE